MVVLVVIAIVVLLACLGLVGFFYLQLKKSSRMQGEGARLADKSHWGACAKCQQYRVIIDKKTGLCALCWSSMRTKPLS